jgi:peptidyl-prolyl cis-trans isomerase D
MRSMRDSAKWVMLVLSIAFVGWLVLDWVTSRGGAGVAEANPVVATVRGRDVRYSQWNLYLQNQLALARQQRPSGLTDEEVRLVREGAWNEMISGILLEQEIDRLGIRISDREIRDAFRNQPPPEFQTHPAFQTDGQFDIEKYRQYFVGPAVDETLLLQLEGYYRETLPRERLINMVADGVVVSDAELWQSFRDSRETVTVRLLSIDPAVEVADTAVQVTDAEIRADYRERQDDFAKPATATVNLVSLPFLPSAADSAAARQRADSLYQVISSGEATFEDVARAASADSATRENGGNLGPRVRGQLDPAIEDLAFSTRVGRVAEPVLTPFGHQLIRVDSRSSDTVSLHRILVPVDVSPVTEDVVFDAMDELEGVALMADLVTAADSLGIEVRRDVVLTEGSGFVPGAGALGVAVEWALDPETIPGDLSQFFQTPTAYHVLELLDRAPAGVYSLEEVESDIERRLLAEKRKERARELVGGVVEALEAGATFEEFAERPGWVMRDSVTFSRLEFVPGLGQGTEAIGVAFGLEAGELSGVVDAGDFLAILQVVDKTTVTRDEFEQIRESLRQQMTFQRRQIYVQQWLDALRENADVIDFRDQLAAAAAAAGV